VVFFFSCTDVFPIFTDGVPQLRRAPVVLHRLPPPLLPAHEPGVHHRRPAEQRERALPLRLETPPATPSSRAGGGGFAPRHGAVLDAAAVRVQRRGLEERPATPGTRGWPPRRRRRRRPRVPGGRAPAGGPRSPRPAALALTAASTGAGKAGGFSFLEWRRRRRCVDRYGNSRGREEKGGGEGVGIWVWGRASMRAGRARLGVRWIVFVWGSEASCLCVLR
jgi:hypothetical protein